MEKTINIIIDDFKRGMAQCIAEAGLPAVVLEPIIKDLHDEVATIAQNALLNDRQKQKEAEEQKKAEEEKGDEEDGVSS